MKDGLYLLIASALLGISLVSPVSQVCASMLGGEGMACCVAPTPQSIDVSESSCCRSEKESAPSESADHDCSCSLTQGDWLPDSTELFISSPTETKVPGNLQIYFCEYAKSRTAEPNPRAEFLTACRPPLGGTAPAYILHAVDRR